MAAQNKGGTTMSYFQRAYNSDAYCDYDSYCPICGKGFNWHKDGYDYINGELVCGDCYMLYISGEMYGDMDDKEDDGE